MTHGLPSKQSTYHISVMEFRLPVLQLIQILKICNNKVPVHLMIRIGRFCKMKSHYASVPYPLGILNVPAVNAC